jgi:hypothetical protein
MMEDRYLNTLEFDKIIAQLAGHTFVLGQPRAGVGAASTDDAIDVASACKRPPRPRRSSPPTPR